MELLRFLIDEKKREEDEYNVRTLTIHADNVSYNISREMAPIYTMGSIAPIDVMLNRRSRRSRSVAGTISTPDDNIDSFRDGQDINVICHTVDGQAYILFKEPDILNKTISFNRNTNSHEYLITLVAKDVISTM